MKQFKRILAAFALTLVITLSAFAGQMDTGVVPPPPNPLATSAGQMDTGRNGDVPAHTNGEMDTTIFASATEIARNLLSSVLLLI